MVEGKLFTGSHDATMRVWDTTGIRDDTIFGKDDKDADNKANDGSNQDENSNFKVQSFL